MISVVLFPEVVISAIQLIPHAVHFRPGHLDFYTSIYK